MSSLGPFATETHPEFGEIGTTDVAGRIEMVKQFDRDQCMRAMQMPSLQATVRAAVARRLRQLERDGQIARSGTG